jgi:hypothetical protein
VSFASNARSCRANELDSRTLSRARTILARALDGGEHLTRAELGAALRRGRIAASGLRLALITLDAELNHVICSGAMRGKQFTYASFQSRVPRSRQLTRDEALAELTRRYFASHGPATLRDFAWWSGLAMRDVKDGVELVRPAIVREDVKDLEYWRMASQSSVPARAALVSLLPVYDEYLIAYKDREMVVGSGPLLRDAYTNHLVIDGRLAGSWKHAIARDAVTPRRESLSPDHAGCDTRVAAGGRTLRGVPRETSQASTPLISMWRSLICATASGRSATRSCSRISSTVNAAHSEFEEILAQNRVFFPRDRFDDASRIVRRRWADQIHDVDRAVATGEPGHLGPQHGRIRQVVKQILGDHRVRGMFRKRQARQDPRGAAVIWRSSPAARTARSASAIIGRDPSTAVIAAPVAALASRMSMSPGPHPRSTIVPRRSGKSRTSPSTNS